MRGDQKFYEKLCIYSYMFKLQSPSKYSPFYAKHLLRHFFHCSKQFLNSSILMPFSSSAVFLCHLFHISKMFPFENFFHPGKQQKCCSGKIGWIGRVATGVMLFFNQKLLNTQHSVGRCACKAPIMKWANALKETCKKNSLKLNAAPHNNASWCTDTDGFLEHSPSGGSSSTRGPPSRR